MSKSPYSKPAKNFDEQVDLLQRRGMLGDATLIKRYLETTGYYRLSG